MKIKKIIFSASIIIFICAAMFGILVQNGAIWITSPFEIIYQVRGVDVSSYQGDIDWDILSQQGIKFAFIKATEGSTFIDRYFKNNWENACKTDLRIGAYHFFSFDSSGKTQAQNFIKVVSITDNMLPPVIDLEFYGEKAKNPPSKEEVKIILNDLLESLESHYKMRPIIYATKSSYRKYIKGDYNDYDIWIRNLVFVPFLGKNKEWTFWQYSNRKKLKGYNGSEKYIDLNFFNGNIEEFKNYNIGK